MESKPSKVPSTDGGGVAPTLLAISLVVVVFGLVYSYNLGGWLINDDEGSFLYQSWRISEGNIPYEDVFTTRWPLFLYTGAAWMRLVGPRTDLMRALPVAATLATGVLIFIVVRRLQCPHVALLSTVTFLLHPQVFRYGRAFQPEAFYILFSTLGLILFLMGHLKNKLRLTAASGLIFVVACFYKLLAVLSVGGCLLFLVVAWLRTPEERRRLAVEAVVLIAVFAAVFGPAVALVAKAFPHFATSVFGVNLMGQQDATVSQTAANGLGFLILYTMQFAPFLLIAFPAALRGWAGDHSTAAFSWQLPSALAFLVLSRQLFPRHLIYLVPVMAILFAISLEPIRRMRHRLPLFLCVVGSVLVPWSLRDTGLLLQREGDTLAVSQYIQDKTPPGATVLSDYQALNFNAQRPSTYLGAELSGFLTSSGQITGADLIEEIETTDVQMVIMDVSPETGHHMVNLVDYDMFRSYVHSNFTLQSVLHRADQQLEVYLRHPSSQ